MLVLQRKVGESLLIGEDTRITVMETGTDGVKLAIEAPKEIKILREELAEAVKMNQDSVADKKQLKSLKEWIKEE